MKDAFTESAILLCGFQDDNPEIYILSDPGKLNSALPEGFGVVGSGEDTAKSRLFTLETNPRDSLVKVLYDAYDAKEACAEHLPDVGHEWDAMILVAGKMPTEVPDEIKELIETLYKAHQRSPFDTKRPSPKDWRKRLEIYTETVLSLDGNNVAPLLCISDQR
jgi:hypothetical protein